MKAGFSCEITIVHISSDGTSHTIHRLISGRGRASSYGSITGQTFLDSLRAVHERFGNAVNYTLLTEEVHWMQFYCTAGAIFPILES